MYGSHQTNWSTKNLVAFYSAIVCDVSTNPTEKGGKIQPRKRIFSFWSLSIYSLRNESRTQTINFQMPSLALATAIDLSDLKSKTGRLVNYFAKYQSYFFKLVEAVPSASFSVMNTKSELVLRIRAYAYTVLVL